MAHLQFVSQPRASGHRSSSPRRAFSWVVPVVLVISVIACNFPGFTEAPQPTSPPVEEPALPSPTTVPSVAIPPTVIGTPTLVPPAPSSGPAQQACDLIPAERVKEVFGEDVTDTSADPAACVHVLASGSSATATIMVGDAARNSFIGPIAQLSTQEGCSMSFSYSSGSTAEPTPLPPEVEQLVAGKSLVELARTYLDVRTKKCGEPMDSPAQYGDLTFFQTMDLAFVETASLGIIQGDKYITYTVAVADPSMDTNVDVLEVPQAQEWLKGLAQPVFAP